MTGELVHGDGQRTKAYLLLPPEDAAAEALAAYLGRATFVVHEGEPKVDELSRAREFTLAAVLDDFPAAGEALVYPCASVTAVGDVEHQGGFTPSVLEHTFDEAAGTVLWSLGEAQGLLQLDLWADSSAVGQALAARLPDLFNPNEGMSGMLLTGPPAYHGSSIRYLLLSHRSGSTLESAAANERRITATVRWEAPLLALRCARRLDLRRTVEVT